jgi:outer membrane protein assembly factor BamB
MAGSRLAWATALLALSSVTFATAVLRGGAVGADQFAPTEIWRIEGEGVGVPVADASTAYFLSKRHEVIAVDAAAGVPRWRQGTGEPGETTSGSVLLLAASLVVAGDYDVVAFDRQRGSVRWRFSPADGYGPGIYLGSAAGGLVFTGSPAGRAYAIDARTGTQRWSTLVMNDSADNVATGVVGGHGTTVFQPVTDGGDVFAPYTTFTAPTVGGVVALEATTGHVRWRAAFPRPADSSLGTGWAGGPLVVDDVVLVVSGDGQIHGFNRGNGALRWSLSRVSQACPGAVGPVDRDFRSLAHSGRLVFAGSLTGCVVAFDLDTRRERWRYSGEEGSVGWSLAADEEVLYVPYAGGRLIVVGMADGRPRWDTGNGRQGFRWPPAIANDRLYFASSTQGFHAFRRPTRF